LPTPLATLQAVFLILFTVAITVSNAPFIFETNQSTTSVISATVSLIIPSIQLNINSILDFNILNAPINVFITVGKFVPNIFVNKLANICVANHKLLNTVVTIIFNQSKAFHKSKVSIHDNILKAPPIISKAFLINGNI
jgi:hypothetical protein